MLTVTFEGFTVVQQRLAHLTTLFPQLAVQGVQQEAEHILEASWPLTPVDTGLMLSTGMVIAQPQGADIRVGGFGLAPYTALVHEDTTMNHPNGGQHHFLSQPLFEATGDLLEKIATSMRA